MMHYAFTISRYNRSEPLNPDKELRAYLQSMAIISYLRLIDIKNLIFFTKIIATVRV
jgi:hypothetical protein